MSGIFVVCSYNYEKEDEDELTITVGEKLELVDEVDENGWVTARNAKGESGLIPMDFWEWVKFLTIFLFILLFWFKKVALSKPVKNQQFRKPLRKLFSKILSALIAACFSAQPQDDALTKVEIAKEPILKKTEGELIF